MLIDTHAHLTDPAFSTDLEEVVFACQQKGMKVITSGYDIASSQQAIALAEKYENIFASIGIYPEFAENCNENALKTLKNLAKNKKVVAIGEIGLQYTDNMPDKEIQKNTFIKQLKLAQELQLPVVIHCRDAYGDMIEILKNNKHLLSFGGTFHCFCGSEEIAKEGIKLGLYISVGGVSTFKNATKIQQTIKNIPIEKILLETDCPYLSPHPYRGKRNQPIMSEIIAKHLAELKGISPEEVEKITQENARRLFKI